MVKRLLIRSRSCPFRNWKSLEMWISLFSVTSRVSSPIPPLSMASLKGTELPFPYRNVNTNSKGFTTNLIPILFPNPKSRYALPSPGGSERKNRGKHRHRHPRTLRKQHGKQASTLQTSGKHVNFQNQSILLMAWIHHLCLCQGMRVLK